MSTAVCAGVTENGPALCMWCLLTHFTQTSTFSLKESLNDPHIEGANTFPRSALATFILKRWTWLQMTIAENKRTQLTKEINWIQQQNCLPALDPLIVDHLNDPHVSCPLTILVLKVQPLEGLTECRKSTIFNQDNKKQIYNVVVSYLLYLQEMLGKHLLNGWTKVLRSF